jgi:hypothetical protein
MACIRQQGQHHGAQHAPLQHRVEFGRLDQPHPAMQRPLQAQQ